MGVCGRAGWGGLLLSRVVTARLGLFDFVPRASPWAGEARAFSPLVVRA